MDTVTILGDFNARVGNDWKSWPNVIGKHGVEKMDSSGLILLILHKISAQHHRHNVPNKRQLDVHLPTPTFKALEST